MQPSDSDLCVICIDAPRTHLLAPCGHRAVCGVCAHFFGEEQAAAALCPMCRAPVQQVIRVCTTDDAPALGELRRFRLLGDDGVRRAQSALFLGHVCCGVFALCDGARRPHGAGQVGGTPRKAGRILFVWARRPAKQAGYFYGQNGQKGDGWTSFDARNHWTWAWASFNSRLIGVEWFFQVMRVDGIVRFDSGKGNGWMLRLTRAQPLDLGRVSSFNSSCSVLWFSSGSVPRRSSVFVSRIDSDCRMSVVRSCVVHPSTRVRFVPSCSCCSLVAVVMHLGAARVPRAPRPTATPTPRATGTALPRDALSSLER